METQHILGPARKDSVDTNTLTLNNYLKIGADRRKQLKYQKVNWLCCSSESLPLH